MPNARLAHRRAAILAVAAALVAGSAGAALPTPAAAASPDVVISQVYGGGGNSGATYTNDFVELFNRGTSTVSVDGWSVQYASATGTGNFGSSTTQITPLAGSIGPGQYLLVQEAQGSGGTTSLPTPDVTDRESDRDVRQRRQGRARQHGRDARVQRQQQPLLGRAARPDRRPGRLGQRQLLRGLRGGTGNVEHDGRAPRQRRLHRHR